MDSLNIVFMGTPSFAVPCLNALHQAHRVVCVFCQPDRPRGRSRKPQPCPVKEAALLLNLPVFQPERVKKAVWVDTLADLKPDLIVVAAFGQILSRKILAIPTLDCINVHASLLPRWRGASPIHHAMLAGDEMTGIAIMRMVRELDAGPVFSFRSTPISDHETRTQLEQRLSAMGAELLLETLPRLREIQPETQDESRVTFAPMITKEMGICDFQRPAIAIQRQVRAMEGWPGTQAWFRENALELVDVEPVTPQAEPAIDNPGKLVHVSKKHLHVACGENTTLAIHTVKPAGKKAMPAHAFINGYHPRIGESLNHPSRPL